MRRATSSVPPRVSGLYRMSIEELSAEAHRVLAATGTSSAGLPAGSETTSCSSSSSSSSSSSPQARPAVGESRSSLHPLTAVVSACAIAATFVHIATQYELQDDWRRPSNHPDQSSSAPGSGSTPTPNDLVSPVPRARVVPAPAAEPAPRLPALKDPTASQRSLEYKTLPTGQAGSLPAELVEYQASLGKGAFIYLPASLPAVSQPTAYRVLLSSSNPSGTLSV